MLSRNFGTVPKRSTISVEDTSKEQQDIHMTKKIADSKMTLASGTSEGIHGGEYTTQRSKKKKGPMRTHTSEFKERRLNNGFVVREMKPKLIGGKGPANVEIKRMIQHTEEFLDGGSSADRNATIQREAFDRPHSGMSRASSNQRSAQRHRNVKFND